MNVIDQVLREIEEQALREQLLDRFLDLYAAWRKSGSDLFLRKAIQVAYRLEAIDPDFHFERAA